MEIRHAMSPAELKRSTTEELRNHLLVENLMKPGVIELVYSHYDRVVVGGVVPQNESLKLDTVDALKTAYFLERREVGIINVGESGTVEVDGETFVLGTLDGLYIGRGQRTVTFTSDYASRPARFYLVSALAHSTYPTRKIDAKAVSGAELGSDEQSNARTLYRYIHEEGVTSCQLMLGLTVLKPNNMWNTMPPHVHDRRMEVYFYFNLPQTARIFHLLGEPQETRHVVVKNEEVVFSPSWSIHSGVGTSHYAFIWAMAGENYTFADMDTVEMKDLK